MAGNSAGQIDLDLALQDALFQRQLNGIAGMANNLVGGAFRNLGGIIAGAFAIDGLVNFARESINLASDLQEVQNVVDVTFGSMAADINDFASGALQQFGLSELSAKKYSSTMGAMLKSSGLTGTAIRDMSKELTGLSADMASFYNLANDEAFEKIRSGIAGETDPLMQLGINMSVANMEAFALSQGITKAWNSMTQAEQTLLRYNYLMSVSADAQGDFARTSGGWANQVRLLTEQWNIFKGTMGAGFINALAPVVKGLNWLITKLQVAAAYFKAFTALIFGDAMKSSSGGAATSISNVGGAAVGAGTDMSALADSAKGAGGSVGDAGKAANKAGKETKKAGKAVKGSLASFDQLNILAKSAADSLGDAAKGAGAAAGGAGGLGDLGAGAGGVEDIDFGTPDMTVDVDPIQQQVQAMLDVIKSGFSEAWAFLTQGWSGLRPALQPFVDMMVPIGASARSIGKTFLQLKDEVLVPVAKYLIQDFIPSITVAFVQSFAPVIANTLVWAFEEFDKTFKNVTNDASRLWKTVWLPNLDLVKNAFVAAMPVIANALQSLLTGSLQPFVDFMLNSFLVPVSSSIVETLVPLLGTTLVWAIQTFTSTFQNAVTVVNQLWQGTMLPALQDLTSTLLTAIPQIGASLGSLLEETLKPFVEYMLNDFIIPIAAKLSETFIPILSDTLVTAIGIFATAFDNATKMVNDLFANTWLPSVEKVKSAFLIAMTSIGGSIDDMLKTVIMPFVDYAINDFILPIVAELQRTFVPIFADVLVAAFGTFSKAFQVAVQLVKNLYDTVLKPTFNLIKSIVMDTLQNIKELWDKYGADILASVAEMINNLMKLAKKLWDEILKPIIEPFLKEMQTLWDGTIGDILKLVAELVLKLISAATDIYNKFISPLLTLFVDQLKPGIVSTFTTVGRYIASFAKDAGVVIKGLLTTLGGLIDFVAGVFTLDWTRAWEGIKSIFKGIFQSLWGIVKLPLNLIIEAINGIIDGFNSISVTIPEVEVFGQKIGGGKIGMPQIPKIPRLAKGGLAYGPTLAMVGDNRGASVDPEVVTPLSKLEGMLGNSNQAVVEVLTLILEAIRNNDKSAVLQIGETEFGRMAIKAINQTQRQAGRTLLDV